MRVCSQYNDSFLTPNIDHLFDYGFISFDKDGKIVISRAIAEKEYKALGLSEDIGLGKIEEGHLKYILPQNTVTSNSYTEDQGGEEQ